MPNTEAERVGLKEGDQILAVNDYDFLDIDHSRAVQILKGHKELRMHVRYFPFGYKRTYEVTTAETYDFLKQVRAEARNNRENNPSFLL